MFAVIPTFLLAGPAALLAALGPVLLAGLAIFWRRWCVALAVASLNGTLYLLHVWFRGMILDTPWASPVALWACLTLVTAVGALLSAWRGWRRPKPTRGRFAEAGLLAIGFAACAWQAGSTRPVAAVEVDWVFEAPDRGLVLVSPVADDQRIYVTVAHSNGLSQFGTVYALDPGTGKRLWSFNRGRRMKQSMSAPAVLNGRLYVGEGLHEDEGCGLYCLDAASGQEIWRFATGSHVESSPTLAGDRVVFGAGDDGVYAVDAATGQLRWQFPGLHVDATLAFAQGRVYGGGTGARPELFCLDAATGQPHWRQPTDLTLFGAAQIVEDAVYCGLGNGKLNQAAARPAGAVVCLDAATGQQRWRHDVSDAVIGAPALDAHSVCVSARNGQCFRLHRDDGAQIWKERLASSFMAGPVQGRRQLFVASSDGTIHALDPRTGASRWCFAMGQHSRTTPEVTATPLLREGRLYLGAGLHNSINAAAVVYCLRMPLP